MLAGSGVGVAALTQTLNSVQHALRIVPVSGITEAVNKSPGRISAHRVVDILTPNVVVHVSAAGAVTFADFTVEAYSISRSFTLSLYPLQHLKVKVVGSSVGIMVPGVKPKSVIVVASEIESALAWGTTMAANSKGMIHKDFRIRCLLGVLEDSLWAGILPGVTCVKTVSGESTNGSKS
jgi:hypothetical protein